MRLAMFEENGKTGIAASDGAAWHGLLENEAAFPGCLDSLLGAGVDLAAAGRELIKKAPQVELEGKKLLPPLRRPNKIICIGLNYADHAAESGVAIPNYPDMFLRVGTSLCGHNQPLLKSRHSDKFDYEAELAMVVGKGGRDISPDKALEHVAGYAVFNDGSMRDYQGRVSQWCTGKNFDSSGAFGPWLVTADALPPGADGLDIKLRLNGKTMQHSNTRHLIFNIATLIACISQGMTLLPGDVFVTGTPAGVGATMTPPVFMRPGDVCEVEIEGIGTLSNPVVEG